MSDLSAALQRGAARIGVVLPKSLVRFIGVGLTGLVVQTSVLTGLLQLHVDKSQAWLVGMLTATAVTWALNRRFTFGSSGRRRRHELFRYLLVTGAAQSVSYAMFRMFAFLIPRLPLPIGADLAAVVATDLGAVIATAVSYTGQRFFTFARVDDDGPADPDPKA